ncbi:MAG: epoxyqueuosine reductase QueH [Firmicutes bacterium]|nr:epoxyqueuosine reductase QueH [Bacillota bacterium]
MKINYNKEMNKTIEELKGKRPKILLHSCCGPCSTSVIDRLNPYFEIIVYYYNPNISPEEEYLRRAEEQINYLKSIGIEYVLGDYEIEKYESAVRGLEKEKEGGLRCLTCFRLRLEKTAQKADELNIGYFTTTLTVSAHKNSQLINEAGIKIARNYEVSYLASDFKKEDGYKKSVDLSKELGMYRQDYCGCKFSKKESEIKSEDKI